MTVRSFFNTISGLEIFEQKQHQKTFKMIACSFAFSEKFFCSLKFAAAAIFFNSKIMIPLTKLFAIILSVF